MTDTMGASERPALPIATPAAAAPVFHADAPDAPSLAHYPALDLLADLGVHKQSQTPLAIGLFGGPGAGKTHALLALGRRLRGLAAQADDDSPFHSEAVTIAVDARDLSASAAQGLASALHKGLQSEFAGLAAKAIEASTDPQTAAQAAGAKLAEVRERLGAEHQRLDDLRERRASLNEDLLFGAANTSLDDYAKSNRKRIEAALTRFGFSGDALATYKELLRDFAARPARLTAFVDSHWAYAGQTRLLIFTLIFCGLSFALTQAQQNGVSWLADLGGAADVANLAEAHAHWFGYLGQGALAIGLLCLILNITRALRFARIMSRGLHLLEEVARASKGRLDAEIARQSRLIAELSDETQALAGLLQSAEARTRERSGGGDPFAMHVQGSHGPDADAYLSAVCAGIGESHAPERVIVLLDGLEALPAQQAAKVVDEAHHLLNRSGFALVIAADPQRLSAGWGGGAEATQRFEKYVQAPFNLRMIRTQQAGVVYAQQLMGAMPLYEDRPPDATTSALDAPLKVVESHLISKLAGLAGDTPRAVKRFLNCWRIARPMLHDTGALALMLALDHGGDAGELAAMGAAMDLEEPGKALEIHPGEPRLAAALASVNSLRQAPLTHAQAHAAWMVARDYSLPSA